MMLNVVLIILILMFFIFIWLGSRKTLIPDDGEPVFSYEEVDKLSFRYFKQISESVINELYDSIQDKLQTIKETETLQGEGKLGSSLLPVGFGGSKTRTKEIQPKPPTLFEKVEHVLTNFKKQNKLTVISYLREETNESYLREETKMVRFENLLKELKEFNIELHSTDIDRVKNEIENNEPLETLLRKRFSKHTKLNCLIRNFPFQICKNKDEFELKSGRDLTKEPTVLIKITNETLTPIGRSFFDAAINETRHLSIFGEAVTGGKEGNEYIFVTPFAIY